MKIEGSSISPVGSVKGVNRVSKAERKSSSMGNDNVAVSDKGQLFQSLMQKAKELPDMREDRVKELSQQIDKGEYKVDVNQISQRLIP